MSSGHSNEQHLKTSKDIPVRKVVVNDPNQLPMDYGTTPGGTIFSTTPGGTRIVYERKFLLQCRNSPHSMSPPCNLPTIPGVTEPEERAGEKMSSVAEESARVMTPKENIAPADVRKSQERSDGMFDMDM
ncbi:eukaryotic translation initiation factor 4E-binding protein 2-like [Watersipora subatra]|uniref:eukaryotic translation initiation factor 4E-binding protein 2-like n=1 Tax=Watersipora subatra TaxID=2589382 RepID=UPI00355B2EB5